MTGCTCASPKALPGFGLSARNLGEHLGEVVLVDAAEPQERRVVAARDQFEIGEQRRHRRVEAVALAELDGEAFGEIARADAGRLEALDDGERRARRASSGAPSRSAIAGEVGAQIAGLVDLVDQRLADQAHRVGSDGHQAELVGEMVGERLLARRRRPRDCSPRTLTGWRDGATLPGLRRQRRRRSSPAPGRGRRGRRWRDRCRASRRSRRRRPRAASPASRRRSSPSARRCRSVAVRRLASVSPGPRSRRRLPARAADCAPARHRHRRRGRDWRAAAA